MMHECDLGLFAVLKIERQHDIYIYTHSIWALCHIILSDCESQFHLIAQCWAPFLALWPSWCVWHASALDIYAYNLSEIYIYIYIFTFKKTKWKIESKLFDLFLMYMSQKYRFHYNCYFKWNCLNVKKAIILMQKWINGVFRR